MTKLNSIQKQILRALTFAEPFSTLLEEVPAKKAVIGSELRDLISMKLVQVMEEDSRGWYHSTFHYNADNLHDFRYQITAVGLETCNAPE